MKKLLLAAVVLALVVGSWAQVTATSSAETSGDSAYITISVAMIGLQFEVYSTDGVERGTDDAGEVYTANAAADGYGILADSTGTGLDEPPHWNPCGKGNFVFGVQNTGGITLDIDVGQSYNGPADPNDWDIADGTTPNNFECDGLEVQEYKHLVGVGGPPSLGSDGSHTAPSSWDNLYDATSSELINELIAEDPDNVGDDFWPAHDDCVDLYIGIVAPPSVTSVTSANGPHEITTELVGTVADGS